MDDRSVRGNLFQGHVKLMEKIRLNEEQWRTLVALREAKAMRRPTDAIKVSRRLLSYGLVVEDRRGGSELTERGLSRLNQGR